MPMSVMIGNLMLLLARRVVFVKLLLARRVVDLMLLLMDLTFLSRLRWSLSILTRNLSMHTCFVNPFLSFVAKCFLM